MKQIKAYLHVNRIADVIAAIEAAGSLSTSNPAWARNVSFTRVEGLLQPTHGAEQRYSVSLGTTVIEEVCLELLCDDSQVEPLVKLIERTARTGQELAGWVVAMPVELLPAPRRSEGNYRLYDERHVDRLLFIRHCRSLDLALDEVRTLVRLRDSPEADCGEVNELVGSHLREVTRRVAQLKLLEKQLSELQRRCQKVRCAKNCQILKALGSDHAAGQRAKR